ncbi:MAG: LysE family transporter [Candidatus Cryptobacteroides sp.]|uniref:LysE family translocator n=1 Tax=Candidatus Cryptobacteroides sp. TaxID=2952915 RepID=UPI002A81FABD|nr:LysE family transporter [Candidatus Cryptobacteroides sp.]MDY5042834.1 LysE family transporter [Candidatus Cryptobacteroides sp.]
MIVDVLKAFAIGICASAPLGPAAILVLQKSLSYGHRAGFYTGLGATTIDTTYATLSIFALAWTQDFINTYEYTIYLIGGPIVALLGASMAFKDPFRKLKNGNPSRGASIKDYAEAVLTALSNPGAAFVMFALFAFFNVNAGRSGFSVLPIILGVAAGSMAYWFTFSYIFSKIRNVIKMSALVWLSRIAGIIVMIIGIALLGEGTFQLFFNKV